MKNILWVVLVLISIVIFGMRISKGITFKQNVTGYLKRAADASTIELANEELTKALVFLESNDLTSGYTSIMWQTPDEDIDFWYRNLKASQHELQHLNSESALERTNVLIKLRETLMSAGKKNRVTVPDGLAVYPNNMFWAVLMTAAILLGFWGLMIPVMEYEKREKERLQNNKQ